MFNLFGTWFNIGPLTVIVLLLLIAAVWQIIKLAKSVRRKKDDIPWRILMVALTSLILLPAAFFEIRLQIANATMTGLVRQISGNYSAVARCQRDMGDSLNFNTYIAHGLAYIDKQDLSIEFNPIKGIEGESL